MKRSRVRTLATVGVIALGGCGGGSLAGGGAEVAPVSVEARRMLDTLARGDVDSVAARLDVSQQSPDARAKLRQMMGVFPKTHPTRVRMVEFGQQRVKKIGGSATEMSKVTFESIYPEANLLSQLVFQRVDDGELRIVGFHVNPIAAPLEVLNAFSIFDVGPIQYLFILLMAGVAIVTVVATVLWVRRRKSIRRRWWWLIAILIGAFKISINWKTGGVSVQALTVQLLSLSSWRPFLDGPWMFAFSIPAGAIAFLILQRRVKAVPADTVTAGPPPAS